MKRSTLKSIIVMLLLAVIGVGIIGFASSGFSNWDKDAWRERFITPTSSSQDSSEDPNDSEEPTDPLADIDCLQRKTYDLSNLVESDFTIFPHISNYNQYQYSSDGLSFFYNSATYDYPKQKVNDYIEENNIPTIGSISVNLSVFGLTDDDYSDHEYHLYINKTFIGDTTMFHGKVLFTNYYFEDDFSVIDILLFEIPFEYPEYLEMKTYDFSTLTESDFELTTSYGAGGQPQKQYRKLFDQGVSGNYFDYIIHGENEFNFPYHNGQVGHIIERIQIQLNAYDSMFTETVDPTIHDILLFVGQKQVDGFSYFYVDDVWRIYNYSRQDFTNATFLLVNKA